MNFAPVIAGLVPAIHPAKPKRIFGLMDARVKPAHDGMRGGGCGQSTREIAR
jgi:hypothetical protein